MSSARPFIVLSIAGSDPTGGAGIQGDLKTFAAHGAYGTAVISAVTAQNHAGVQAMVPVDPALLEAQLESLFDQVVPDAVKTGMLGSAANVEVVGGFLSRRPVRFLVVDPVLHATSGGALSEPGLAEALKARLFPLATLVTPNREEAAALLDGRDRTPARAGDLLLSSTRARAVLLKGGHHEGPNSIDWLFWRAPPDRPLQTSTGTIEMLEVHHDEVFALPRLRTEHGHGAGCALSAAIACRLARGDDLMKAVYGAKAYVHRALAAAAALGAGRGPVHHAVPPD